MNSDNSAFVFGCYKATEDMRAVTIYLQQIGIEHRFILTGSEQQLILLHPDEADATAQTIALWRAGKLVLSDNGRLKLPRINLIQQQAPCTLTLLFFAFLGTALAAFGEAFIHLFTFWDLTAFLPALANPWVDISQGQIWRLITPVFLHFGIIHILFNALWFWYLGTIIEQNQGCLALLALILLIAAVSNSAQALVSGVQIFGGLSGVVYGLFAYCWLWGVLNRASAVCIPNALFVVITVLMLLSPLGLFDIIVGGEVADTAHISGYISGILIALVASFASRMSDTGEPR